jgi:hypothetical protein
MKSLRVLGLFLWPLSIFFFGYRAGNLDEPILYERMANVYIRVNQNQNDPGNKELVF